MRPCARGILLLVINLLCGCGRKNSDLPGFGPGSADFTYKLAGNYQLSRSSAKTVLICPDGDLSASTMIPPMVVEVAWDTRFILAKRQVLNDTDTEIKEGHFDFWLIDIQGPQRHGPYNESVFAAKRSALGVPASLELKDVYSFK